MYVLKKVLWEWFTTYYHIPTTQIMQKIVTGSWPTELGVVGKWGCRCPSKCSVGTAGRRKNSIAWLLDKNISFQIYRHLDLISKYNEFSKLFFLVTLVLRPPCMYTKSSTVSALGELMSNSAAEVASKQVVMSTCRCSSKEPNHLRPLR